MSDNNITSSPKKEFFLKRWVKRMLWPNKEVMSIYEEERMQSPARVVAKNFFSKPIPVIALIVLICIALTVFLGPMFVSLDLSEQDSTLTNIRPGFALSKFDPALENNNCKMISAGPNYSVGVSNDGKVYVWGQTRINKSRDLADIPKEVQEAHIVMVAAGYDHIVAVDDQNVVYAWGNDRLGQLDIPDEIDSNNRLKQFEIKAVYADNQFSAIVTSDKRVFLWGNANMVDMSFNKEYEGHIEDVALLVDGYISLLDNGSVAYTGYSPKSAATSSIPEKVKNGGVVQIASTSRSGLAVLESGEVVVWGATNKGEAKVPELAAAPKKVMGGRYHYSAVLQDGSVVSWGNDRYKQTQVPASLDGAGEVQDIYVGKFQNYAVDSDGDIHVWGLKGFLMGSDTLGRDIFARLINGGKMTMTIGGVAVIIQSIIGIILGGLAGYFGGKVDILLSRLAEIVSSLPFIPFAMILSAVLGTLVSTQQRMYIIMIILGILSWPGIYRLIRAQMFAQREMEYVTAAKTLGLGEGRIIFRHIIPNVMSVVLVSITLAFGSSMLTESSLSYLGFGIPLPTPTWGNMLSNANNSVIIQNYWWNWVFVAAVFGTACICINLIGDGLRDALDPKSSER